ncbi:cytotoxic translational repressor of toxin-antitoxin stability system [Paenarthrobacter sp. PH39-S1]|uniref:cytotoxic translational repressor of toxin-antitoxin stability system n=1 Tax=Paenarthrobacter sp. PH39-S1 TaxID=3046204 RepID=UPI0024B89A21|nr:cytotoxic translational repressor of toxin-antitoxin stability system [Paenarthrobacter sp. PH39-S1]MDJ0358228.1 cytotoxic translational repressor of toxin-antitoxin stability system [Paenarthrobacter sp. PH39-S1]
MLNSRGKPVTHHVTYKLPLPDGRALRTRISRPVDRTGYAVAMWRLILRDQLEVTDEVFWACVRQGAIPLRGQPTTTADSLPVKIVWQLTKTVGLREDTVAGMSMPEAIKALQEYWARQAD